jgi:hypothetical protein
MLTSVRWLEHFQIKPTYFLMKFMKLTLLRDSEMRKSMSKLTYLLASEETIEREFAVLESIPDNYPKYVVSMDEIDRGRNGIKNINIRNLLLIEHYSL